MANMSTFLENALLNHVFRQIPFTSPTEVFVGLASTLAVDADLEAGILTNEITEYTGDRRTVVFGAP